MPRNSYDSAHGTMTFMVWMPRLGMTGFYAALVFGAA